MRSRDLTTVYDKHRLSCVTVPPFIYADVNTVICDTVALAAAKALRFIHARACVRLQRTANGQG